MRHVSSKSVPESISRCASWYDLKPFRKEDAFFKNHYVRQSISHDAFFFAKHTPCMMRKFLTFKQVCDMKYSLPSVQLFCNHSYLSRVHGLHQAHQREDHITKTHHESHRRSSSGPGRCECVCTCQIFRCSFESYSEWERDPPLTEPDHKSPTSHTKMLC